MTTIDWERAYDQLERARHRLQQAAEPSPAAARHLLERRAAALARRLDDGQAAADTIELLVFACGEERYGVESRDVAEVVPRPHVAPVPFTPPALTGVASHRGRMIAVIDLARLLSLGAAAAEAGFVVVLACDAALGIQADSVAGIVPVDPGAVAPAAQTAEADDHVIRGLTDDMVAILDVEALASDPRIVVEDEIA